MDKPRAFAPPDPPSAPRVALPAGAVDAHMHMVGDDYVIWPQASEHPAPGALEEYCAKFTRHLSALGLEKAVLVHSILYGDDNKITCDAVQQLGAGFCAVALVRDDVSPQHIRHLADAGMRAVRLNYVHGGLLSWEGAKALAPTLADHGMHIEMLLHSHLHIEALRADIEALPVPLVIDHCGWPDLGLGRSTGQECLEHLLDAGKIWVKLSARYRFDQKHRDEAIALQTQLARCNPDRCVWGSDWPHLMLNGAARPDAGIQLQSFVDALGDDDAQKRIFIDSPSALYRI